MLWYKATALAVVAWLATAVSLAEPVRTDPWGADYFPDVTLTTHTGEEVKFFTDLLKDKVVAINFMFTSCQAVCPTETARLRQVQRLLGDRVGKDVHMYSISIDPARDTPAALAAYARKFDVGPGWTFLRGSKEDIELLEYKLGLVVDDSDDPLDHSTSFVVGNQASGRWIKRSPYEHPSILARLLGDELHNFTKPSTLPLKNYSEAEAVAEQSSGEYIFRTRCNACHSIGGNGESLGPDLLGITTVRDRHWLQEWIKAPDMMLATGDPLAIAFYKRNNGLSMPNLGLTDQDAQAVIEYIEEHEAAAE